MVGHSPDEPLVKSADRVRLLAEVNTPSGMVQAILDMVPEPMWEPTTTFLEPACGDGNFVAALLERKLDVVEKRFRNGALPAGDDADAAYFHALQALASVYGIDISPENIEGGVPGHGIGARERLLATLARWTERIDAPLPPGSPWMRSAAWIVNRNIQVGNMLLVTADGLPSGREKIPLTEYEWDHTERSVAVLSTTMGRVMDDAAASTSGVKSLFDLGDDVRVGWDGAAERLHEAVIENPACRQPQTAAR